MPWSLRWALSLPAGPWRGDSKLGLQIGCVVTGPPAGPRSLVSSLPAHTHCPCGKIEPILPSLEFGLVSLHRNTAVWHRMASELGDKTCIIPLKPSLGKPAVEIKS